MMSICRPKFLISGSDSLILFEGIQLVGHISSWLLSRVLLWVQLTNLSSTNNPFECIYFRLETIVRQVAYKSKLDIPRHHYSRWSPVRRQLNIYSYPAASSVLFGRQFGLGLISHWWTHTLSVWPFCTVHLLSRRSSCTSIFSPNYLALMCVDCVEWTQLATLQKLRVYTSSASGQGQTLLISMAEDFEH
jgi:hypothetical protein